MTRILAIDPGHTQSAYTLINRGNRRPLEIGKIPNDEMLDRIALIHSDPVPVKMAVEMVSSYGMAVGAEVFDTCVWIGRFAQHAEHVGNSCLLIYRKEIMLHHCHSRRAKDSEITRALLDRFAYGVPNYGKGTKAVPGFFYGFRADIWQAYALAVYVADTATWTADSVRDDRRELLAPTL